MNALVISPGAKTSWMIPRPWGINIAAAVPCASRHAISIVGSTANAHASEETTKPTAPSTNSRLRP